MQLFPLLIFVACAAALPTADEIALQKAVYRGDAAETKRLLYMGTKQVLAKEHGGQSCLMIASYKGNLELCKLLLGAGNAEVHAVGKVGKNEGTALLFALIGYDEGSKPNVVNAQQEEAFALIVKLLVEHGTRLGSRDYKSRSPVVLAASARSLRILTELLKHKNAPKALARKVKDGPFAALTAMHLLVDSPKTYVHICTHLVKGYNTGVDASGDYSDVAWQLGDGRTCSLALLDAVKERSAQLLRGVLRTVEEAHSREAVLNIIESTGIVSLLIRHGEHKALEVLGGYDVRLSDDVHKEPLRVAAAQGHTYSSAESCAEGVPASVDVVSDIDSDKFFSEYFNMRKPVVLRGAASMWGCTAWDVDHMLNGDAQALNSTVTVAEIPYSQQYGLSKSTMPLSQYVEEHMKYGSHLYAFDNSMHNKAAADILLSSYGRLSFLDGVKSNPPQWSFGADGSGSPPHVHQDAVNGVCFGKKEWLLWPPALSFLSTVPSHEFYNPLPSWAGQPLAATQEAGDLLYIPEGWGHAVLNVVPTLGVATEYYRV